MATPMTADQFVAALKKEGAKVAEHSGWRTHNRNHVGAWGGVNGVLVHHTAGSSSLSLCYNGRSDLPGPLCHTHLAKTGTATMVGNGRSNHAGPVAMNAHNAVLNESSTHPKPSAASGTTDGNAHYYGIEIENLGTGRDPYPAVQYDAAVRWAAAICRHHGWTANSVVGHKETSIEGKIDPSFGMGQFRIDVAERLTGPADGTTEPDQQEDDVPANLSLGLTKNTALKTDSWLSLAWDKEYGDPLGEHYMPGGQTFVAGPGRYTGAAYLRFTDLAAGATVQARLVEDDDSGKTVQVHPIGEGIGSSGDTFYAFPITGYAAKGRRVKLQVAQFSGKTATVADSYLKALVWNA